MALRSSPLAVAQPGAVGLPAGLPQLGINQQTRGRLIQLQPLGRCARGLLERSQGGSSLALGCCLQLRQPGSQGGLISLGLRGQLLPLLLLLQDLAQLLFGLRQLLGRRRLRWLKRATTKLRITEGAVKPHPQLPGHAQDLQGGGVIAMQIVVSQVALAAQAMEQLSHLPLQHAIALQPPQQLLLGFLLPQLHAKTGGHMLGQQFPQLPQLQQGRIGVVGEIALRQRAQPEQLLVVGAEVGEVGACHGSGIWLQLTQLAGAAVDPIRDIHADQR